MGIAKRFEEKSMAVTVPVSQDNVATAQRPNSLRTAVSSQMPKQLHLSGVVDSP
ncbi:hypothetical protein FHY30_003231 [Xanthomonas arboricola]|uniref:hypothetical protein n=1 Tax=Xanthomonas campestris TaxID=339 RepID=UPI0023EA1EF7|nr:hypothetical protein [Xanthomonas campestris]